MTPQYFLQLILYLFLAGALWSINIIESLWLNDLKSSWMPWVIWLGTVNLFEVQAYSYNFSGFKLLLRLHSMFSYQSHFLLLFPRNRMSSGLLLLQIHSEDTVLWDLSFLKEILLLKPPICKHKTLSSLLSAIKNYENWN